MEEENKQLQQRVTELEAELNDTQEKLWETQKEYGELKDLVIDAYNSF